MPDIKLQFLSLRAIIKFLFISPKFPRSSGSALCPCHCLISFQALGKWFVQTSADIQAPGTGTKCENGPIFADGFLVNSIMILTKVSSTSHSIVPVHVSFLFFFFFVVEKKITSLKTCESDIIITENMKKLLITIRGYSINHRFNEKNGTTICHVYYAYKLQEQPFFNGPFEPLNLLQDVPSLDHLEKK